MSDFFDFTHYIAKNIPKNGCRGAKKVDFWIIFAKNLLELKKKYIFASQTIKTKKIMKALVEQINAQIAAFQANAAAQVEKNNKAAGTRARKAALELSKLLKEFRKVSVEEAKK